MKVYMSAFRSEGKYHIILDGLEMGSYQHDRNPNGNGPSFSFKGQIKFSREKEEDVIKDLMKLGILAYLGTASRDLETEVILGRGIEEKYERIFSKSYELGLKILPNAIDKHRKPLRTNKGVAKKVLKKTKILEYYDLHMSKESVLESLREIVGDERAKKKSENEVKVL